MTRIRQFIRSWGGGIISPELFGRLDDARYQQGAETMENFIPKMGGSLQRRPGFEFVRETKDSTKASRLIPFVYNNGQAVAVELGEEYARFHSEGATLLHITARLVESVDAGSNRITFTEAHGLVADEQIRFFVGSGGAMPSGLAAAGFTRVVDTHTIEVSLTAGGAAQNITSTGTAPIYCYKIADCPTAYIPSRAFSSVSTVSDEITTSGAHNLTNGDPITFSLSGGTLPTVLIGLETFPLLANYVYYANVTGASKFRVSNTRADALANVYFDLNGAGSGAPIEHYYYTPGMTVTDTTYGFFRCIKADPQLELPDGGSPDYWEQLAFDGTLEVATDYAEEDLFSIHYTQSGDIKTLVHPSYPPHELRRLSATQWSYTAVVFDEALETPSSVTVTPTPGATSTITSVLAGGASVEMEFITTTSTAAEHFLQKGDMVYLSQPSGTAIGVASANTFYIVNSLPSIYSFTLRQVNGGALLVGGSSGAAPANALVRVASQSTDITSWYSVTAVDANGRESAGSSAEDALNNLLSPGSYNTVAWAPVAGAERYNVYKLNNGIYGYIGSTLYGGTTFVDDGIAPDMSVVLPTFDETLSSTDYPSAVAYFEGRRVFGGTTLYPQGVWMSQTGVPDSMAYHIPVQDNDRIRFDIESQEASRVLHLVPTQFLVALTNSTEYRIGGVNNDAITPDSVSVRPQSYVGGSNVQPVVVDRTIVFASEMGNHLFEMGWTANEGFQPADLCLRAPHLFENETIVDMTFAKSPQPIVWVVTSAGRLYGLTYSPAEQIGGWHVHKTEQGDSQGFFESVCSIPEGDEHRLYAIVRRTIDGATVRNVERMASLRRPATLAESKFLDSGGEFYGAVTGKSLTITPVTTWASGTTVTLTGTTLFRLGSSDVGDRVKFTYGGLTFYARVSAVTDTNTASAVLLQAVTDAAGTTLTTGAVPNIVNTSWSWMRDSLSNLGHLEGESIQLLADGDLLTKTVTNGEAALGAPYERVIYGLPIESTLRTLPIVYGSESFGQGATSAINKVWMRTVASEPFKMGRELPATTRINDVDFSDTHKVSRPLARGLWDDNGQVYVYQDLPYPLTLVSMTVEASIGS